MKAALFALLACIALSFLLFGGPLQALVLLTSGGNRLGLPYWPALILAAMAFAIAATGCAARFGAPKFLFPSLFILVSAGLSALFIGAYAEIQRERIVRKFEPDVEIRSSIFASFRHAPREFQFFLHGAALKDCQPYGWSYREMAFYEIPPNTAVNVLPRDWIRQCNIKRAQ